MGYDADKVIYYFLMIEQTNDSQLNFMVSTGGQLAALKKDIISR